MTVMSYLLLTSVVFGQTAEKKEAPAGKKDWAVNCQVDPKTDKLLCQMSQRLTQQKTGQQVLSVVIRPSPNGKNPTMLLALPHGLDLQKGISLRVDEDKPVTAPLQTSDRNGVYSAFPLTDELIKSMKNGGKLIVQMQSVQKKPFKVNVSLSGFTSAIDRLAKLK